MDKEILFFSNRNTKEDLSYVTVRRKPKWVCFCARRRLPPSRAVLRTGAGTLTTAWRSMSVMCLLLVSSLRLRLWLCFCWSRKCDEGLRTCINILSNLFTSAVCEKSFDVSDQTTKLTYVWSECPPLGSWHPGKCRCSLAAWMTPGSGAGRSLTQSSHPGNAAKGTGGVLLSTWVGATLSQRPKMSPAKTKKKEKCASWLTVPTDVSTLSSCIRFQNNKEYYAAGNNRVVIITMLIYFFDVIWHIIS